MRSHGVPRTSVGERQSGLGEPAQACSRFSLPAPSNIRPVRTFRVPRRRINQSKRTMVGIFHPRHPIDMARTTSHKKRRSPEWGRRRYCRQDGQALSLVSLVVSKTRSPWQPPQRMSHRWAAQPHVVASSNSLVSSASVSAGLVSAGCDSATGAAVGPATAAAADLNAAFFAAGAFLAGATLWRSPSGSPRQTP